MCLLVFEVFRLEFAPNPQIVFIHIVSLHSHHPSLRHKTSLPLPMTAVLGGPALKKERESS